MGEVFYPHRLLLPCLTKNRSADLGTAIQGYVQSMTSSVENVHKDLIDNVYGPTFLNFSSGKQV